MESGDQQNRTHEIETKPDVELDIDAALAGPIDFVPPVKDWIEYLASLLTSRSALGREALRNLRTVLQRPSVAQLDPRPGPAL